MRKASLILTVGLITGLSALASDLPKFVETCRDLGLEKLRREAQLQDSILQEETFAVCATDNRWYNPSKYVLYCANVTNQDGSVSEITRVVQYYRKECF